MHDLFNFFVRILGAGNNSNGRDRPIARASRPGWRKTLLTQMQSSTLSSGREPLNAPMEVFEEVNSLGTWVNDLVAMRRRATKRACNVRTPGNISSVQMNTYLLQLFEIGIWNRYMYSYFYFNYLKLEFGIGTCIRISYFA